MLDSGTQKGREKASQCERDGCFSPPEAQRTTKHRAKTVFKGRGKRGLEGVLEAPDLYANLVQNGEVREQGSLWGLDHWEPPPQALRTRGFRAGCFSRARRTAAGACRPHRDLEDRDCWSHRTWPWQLWEAGALSPAYQRGNGPHEANESPQTAQCREPGRDLISTPLSPPAASQDRSLPEDLRLLRGTQDPCVSRDG